MDIDDRSKKLIETLQHEIGNGSHDPDRASEIISEGKNLINLLYAEKSKLKKHVSIMQKRLKHEQKKRGI